ncbi:tautomerase family protein [Eoetvoesiella caeni]|uniref:4-oxalocrotonate tautomerase family enzyme n=1 Tax=Eoetvoesiella caeni TaxID=645616 RepID=A0A366H0R5_9BURK|nr:tautomerase family protein [Eoetvoesiella caeni]MCI2810982.1 4-oxalocrotonate tautomerase family protein [Eoetvoesiella caeni]NYT56880.1 tautomerase family protein [Eoetvoesiella caeni]RBP35448.1 4-oxalocrotonate tautomerase family enzyme [Eoetvoesiella caeni]
MPILKLSSVMSPDAQTIERLISRLTEVVVEEMKVPLQSVNVMFEHVEAERWGVGGETLKQIFARNSESNK